jgi:hypothetical protein
MEINPRKSQTWAFPLKSQAKPVSAGFQFDNNKIMVLDNSLDQTPAPKSKQELLGSGLSSLAPHSSCLSLGPQVQVSSLQLKILNSMKDSHSASGVIPREVAERKAPGMRIPEAIAL